MTADPGSSSGVECPLYNGHCKKAGDMGINLHEPEAWPSLSPDPIQRHSRDVDAIRIWGQVEISTRINELLL